MMSEYDIVVEKLKKKADAKYKAFNDRIVVSGYETIGVRIPDIKKSRRKSIKRKSTNTYPNVSLRTTRTF